MDNRDTLLELVQNYINDRNVSPSLFSNLFSTSARRNTYTRRQHTQPSYHYNSDNETQRLHAIFMELLMSYNSNIMRYQENMDSLISIYRRFITQQTQPARTRRNQNDSSRIPTPAPPNPNPSTFYYSWVPQGQNIFENVIVAPSQEEIQRASFNSQYDSEHPPINTRCPITIENFQDGDNVTTIHHCGHTFYATAFTNWFRTNVRCPVCRYDIREYRGNNNSPQNDTENEQPDEQPNEQPNEQPDEQPDEQTTTNNRRTEHSSTSRPRINTTDFANLMQRMITESLSSSISEYNAQQQNDATSRAFTFDFSFPSIIADISGDISYNSS